MRHRYPQALSIVDISGGIIIDYHFSYLNVVVVAMSARACVSALNVLSVGFQLMVQYAHAIAYTAYLATKQAHCIHRLLGNEAGAYKLQLHTCIHLTVRSCCKASSVIRNARYACTCMTLVHTKYRSPWATAVSH